MGGLLVLTSCTGGTAPESAESEESSTLSSLPTQPPGTVREIALTGGLTKSPPQGMDTMSVEDGGGFLAGPYFSLKVAWVATGPAITDHPMNRHVYEEPRRAAPGQELLVFQVDPSVRGGDWVLRDDQPAPVAELVVAGVAVKLEKSPLRSRGGSYTPSLDGAVAVASVPTGAPVSIRVTDTGRAQTLDLRTGRRAADAIGGYYRKTSQKVDWQREDVPIGFSVPAEGRSYRSTLDIGFKSLAPSRVMSDAIALLAPYSAKNGWAAPGRAWLKLPRPTVSGGPLSPSLTLRTSDQAAFRLRLPDGSELAALPGSHEVGLFLADVAEPGPDLTFDVPADFRTGAYVIRLGTGALVAEFRDAKVPARWSSGPAPVEIPINLS
ncbi:hypothetical protein [Herbihabitans rhizosphaerae]|uniref:hypothetical protein n=1 Tax=Herbihabitans rhizosphaerae TaxID=1872711 RepID=UPI00102B5D20|nr:hypothetical protein [Herbihabitans rhizosphaerae]